MRLYPEAHIRLLHNASATRQAILDGLAWLAAQAAFERALRIDEAVYGPEHPKVATDVNNLGSVLWALGDLAGAKVAFERALRIDEAVYGPAHPEDEDARAALRLQLRKLLAEDATVVREVQQILEAPAVQQVIASGDRSVAIGGGRKQKRHHHQRPQHGQAVG